MELFPSAALRDDLHPRTRRSVSLSELPVNSKSLPDQIAAIV